MTDHAWANAAKHYDNDQLAALVCLIALINTYNRLNVITRQPAGDLPARAVGLISVGRRGPAWARRPWLRRGTRQDLVPRL